MIHTLTSAHRQSVEASYRPNQNACTIQPRSLVYIHLNGDFKELSHLLSAYLTDECTFSDVVQYISVYLNQCEYTCESEYHLADVCSK